MTIADLVKAARLVGAWRLQVRDSWPAHGLEIVCSAGTPHVIRLASVVRNDAGELLSRQRRDFLEAELNAALEAEGM